MWIYLNMFEFTIIDRVLNISNTSHSARSLYKLMKPCQRSKIKHFRKLIMAFNYFRKTFHLKSLRGFLIPVWFYICQNSDYSRIVNMLEFWISKVIQGSLIFVNMTGFWVGVGAQSWRVFNILGFRRCQVSAYASVTQGIKYGWIMPE